MAQRAYRRNSRGQFAGSGGRVTYGKAGGFANATHQANAQNARAAAAQNRTLGGGTRPGLTSAQKKRLVRGLVGVGVKVGATVAIGATVNAALGGSPTMNRIGRTAHAGAGAAWAGKQGWKAGRGMGSQQAARRGIAGSKTLKAARRGRGGYKIRSGR